VKDLPFSEYLVSSYIFILNFILTSLYHRFVKNFIVRELSSCYKFFFSRHIMLMLSVVALVA
jgi:hypothetical protein